jgi:hypothetical protein
MDATTLPLVILIASSVHAAGSLIALLVLGRSGYFAGGGADPGPPA